MAEKNYQVNEAIEIEYQAPNAETGLTIIAEIYLPNHSKDSNFPDVTLTEMGSTGVYNGTFTPNAVGEWKVIVHKAGGDGQVVKRYSVGSHNVHGVGEAVADVDADVAVVDGKVDTVDGKVVAVDGKVVGVQGTADSIETKVDDISNIVGGLDSPPMIS